MSFLRLKTTKRSLLVLLPVVFLAIFFISSVNSQSVNEIEDQIKDKEEELAQSEQEIAELRDALEASRENLVNAQEGLPKIEAEIDSIEKEIELNTAEYQFLKEQFELKQIQKEKLIELQNKNIRSSYMEWRVANPLLNEIYENNLSQSKSEQYFASYIQSAKKDINDLAGQIYSLDSDIAELDSILQELNKLNAELAQKKSDLEAEIRRYQNSVAFNSGQINDLRELQGQLQDQISVLLEEQKEAAEKEKEILSSEPPPMPIDPPPAVDNGFYFTGRGRDLYQGHGVGMSQWGAHGAAVNGLSAEQIVKFYYSGTNVEQRPGTVSVQGYGTMDNNTYVAGLGEVPSKACGTSQQASERPDKYVVDNPNTVWDCWPEEAIKAQVIAARSYAMSYGGTICTTAACQVYDGGTAKQWAADETKNLVITSGGQIIEALYSSDNSQGSGTANNDTIFQSFSGNGWPVSYLRAVNDSGFATPTQWTYWSYQTRSYNLQGIYEMLNYTANNPASTAASSTKNNVRNFLNGSSSFTNIQFETDPSGRVKKVWLTDQNGTQKSIGGWWFKNVWNNYVYDVGTYDYLYSQTFFINYQ